MGAHEGRRLAAAATADVLFKLAPELLDGVLHRPAGPVRQAADRRARHDADVAADLFEDLQVLQPTLPSAETLHDLQHPASPFAAGRTLATRLVREEPAAVVHDVDDA